MRQTFTSETSRQCTKLSEFMFPGIEARYTDIKARDNSTAPRADIYMAGIPCITYASCGKGKGIQDPRGQVWAHSLAYVVENKPKATLLECVPTLITWAKFRPVLSRVIRVLEQLPTKWRHALPAQKIMVCLNTETGPT